MTDYDNQNAAQNIVFQLPRLYEAGIDAYDDVPAQRAYSDDVPGDAVSIVGNAAAQVHNFHDQGDEDWTIFSMPAGDGYDAITTQLGSAAAHMVAYQVDGDFSVVSTSPDRWDITLSDLTEIDSDQTSGGNRVTLHNNTNEIQAYVIKTTSSGPFGADEGYSIELISNPPSIVDQYDDVPAQRAYSDDVPGDAVSIASNAPAQTHNFHDSGDVDWTIFAMGSGDGYDVKTTKVGSASAEMIAYQVVGDYSEVSPGRWDITLSDLSQVDSDESAGDNTVTIQNITGSIQVYLVKTTSSGPSGLGTDYHIELIKNKPETDSYDDVPGQRAYSDDVPGDAVSIVGNAAAQVHNFHDQGDVDWTIFSMGNNDGYDVITTQQGTASARMIAYRVDGAFTEVSPGRWDITMSDLTEVDRDLTNSTNTVTIQNTTGSVQAYVIKTYSSGPVGAGTDYSIRLISNQPEIDAYDNVPSQRAYSDDAPGDAVSIAGNAAAQIHNFHDQGDVDWTIFSMGNNDGYDVITTPLGSASARMIVYRVDGAFSEISPGRWDITMSDLFEVGRDVTNSGNAVTIQNTTGSVQAYVIKTFSSGAVGDGTNYSIRLTSNAP